MIILNTKLQTFTQYDNAQRENEQKLKAIMRDIIVAEQPREERSGKGVPPIERRKLPVSYTNPKKSEWEPPRSAANPKKIKTFKL